MKIGLLRKVLGAGFLSGTVMMSSMAFASPIDVQNSEMQLTPLAITKNTKVVNKSIKQKNVNIDESVDKTVDNSTNVDKSSKVKIDQSKTRISGSYNTDNSYNADNSNYNSNNTNNSSYTEVTNYGNADFSIGKTTNVNSNNRTEQNTNSKNRTQTRTSNKTRNTTINRNNSGNVDSHNVTDSYNTKQNQEVEATSKVPADALSYGGHHYKVFNDGKTWSAAKSYCEGLGGYLVIITSSGEQSFVQNMVKNDGTRNSYWLGANKQNGSWRWIDGSSLSYSHWANGQPDNCAGIEDSLMMYRGINPANPNKFGDWNDLYSAGTCQNESFFGLSNFGFICEWDS